MSPKSLEIRPLINIPLIVQGDSLADIISRTVNEQSIHVEDGDIFVIAQKVVSKAEGRMINLESVKPSQKAIEVAAVVEKDPRFVELVLQESKSLVRAKPGVLIVEHLRGFISANAGIDHSNVRGGAGEWVLLLPEDPDRSARQIRAALEDIYQVKLGVLIIDSHGRAWRMGTVGTSIGLSGVPGLVDLRGKEDLFGYTLRITQVAAADELAAAASLVMGQADEGTPIVHVRGFPYSLRESMLSEIIRPQEQDLFR